MTRLVAVGLGVTLAVACGPGGGVKDPGDQAGKMPTAGLELVIFSPPQGGAGSGYGLVTERREIELTQGSNEVRFDGVPRTVDGSTVTFRSFTDPAGTVVRSQGYAYDAATGTALLDRQIGREVVVVTESGEVKGTLVSFDAQGITLQTSAGLRVVPVDEALVAIRLAPGPGEQALPATTPTLLWRLDARRGGKHLVEVTYQAARLWWHADHRIVVHGEVDEATPSIDHATTVTIGNGSGKSFDGVVVDLVDVGTAEKKPSRERQSVYRLPSPIRIGPDESRQVTLGTPLRGVPGKRELRYDPVGPAFPHHDAMIEVSYGAALPLRPTVVEDLVFASDRPLPGGRVLVYRQGAAGTDEEPTLVAEAVLEGTREAGPVRVEIGRSSTVMGGRRRVSYRGSPKARKFSETFEISLRNDGKIEQKAVIVEHLYRARTWEILDSSVTPRTVGDRAIEFPVTVPAGKRVRVTYSVEYRY